MARRRSSARTKSPSSRRSTRNATELSPEKEGKDTMMDDSAPQHVSPPTSSASDSDESNSESAGVSTEMSSQPEAKSSLGSDQAVEPSKGYSRLFSPYRTLGVVSEGPFHLLPNQNSSNAVICTAIGERFHMLQCDKLQPVLVSHAVPALSGAPSMHSGPQSIAHTVSDNSLSLTLVAHGPKQNPRQISLFQRTRPVGTLGVLPTNDWTIVDLLHLGKIRISMSGEKAGKKENAALCAVVISKGRPLPKDGVPVLGDDDEQDDDSSSSSSDDASSDEESPETKSRGQVILVVASRSSLFVHKKIDLSMTPDFCPRTAVHPPTYVNKIVLGGSCSKTGKEALILLNVNSGRLLHTFKCLKNKENGKSEISSLETAPALDTLAVGTSKGQVHLVNIRQDVLLFTLRHFTARGEPTCITSMSFRTDGAALQYGIAPLAVGRADGTISVWDLTPPESDDDEVDQLPSGRTLLCEMERVHYPGGVHTIQYLPQEPLLLSTGTHSNSIKMHIFDNPDHSGRILRQRNGHTAPPKYIRYLHPGAGAGGGVLVNSADGTDAASCQILSSGSSDRTLRIFSTVRSVLDKEYSQGKGLEKRARKLKMKSKEDLLLPPVRNMASCETRSRDWGDLVTIHKDHAFAYVWSTKRGAQSGPVLRQEDWNISAMKRAPPVTAHATAVAISTCGNFALVGTRGGNIYKYNVESGNVRGSYPPGEKKKEERGREAGDVRRTFKALEKSMKLSNRASNLDKEDKERAISTLRDKKRNAKLQSASHSGYAVSGIAIDGINKTVISVGEDAKLILWNFKTHTPHTKCPISLPAPATKLSHIKDSDLAAIALADYSLLLFDCSSLTTVRRFGFGTKDSGHSGPINDLGFSPDGRTLFSASTDGTVRVWDVPTNSCVDWLGFATPPTSITVSPTGEFLATTHVGKLGISLWSDRSFYQNVHVDGAREIKAPASMDDPSPIAEIEVEEDHDNAMKRVLVSEERKDDEAVVADEEVSASPVTAKEDGLITMSGLPPAHWKNLFHLELVKQRNKPKEAPKKPPSAPFFLQWNQGQSLGGEVISKPQTDENKEREEEAWDAVWSDDDNGGIAEVPAPSGNPAAKRERDASEETSLVKKRKVLHHRSHLAALLDECEGSTAGGYTFEKVTEHVSTLGPSAIDVSLSTLCNGMHDLEDGLPLLVLACKWLTEACQSRERFEAVNAYVHRFLYLHSDVLAGIQDVHLSQQETITGHQAHLRKQREELIALIENLRRAQRSSSDALHGSMQNTLCLLRHFSRMV